MDITQLEQELAARRDVMLTTLGLFDQLLTENAGQQTKEEQFRETLQASITMMDLYAQQFQSIRQYLAVVQQALDVTEARLPAIRTDLMRRLAECDQIQGMTATLTAEMERQRGETLAIYEQTQRQKE